MKTLAFLIGAALALASCAPAWSTFESKHPKPSLFQNPLPYDGYRQPLPPLN